MKKLSGNLFANVYVEYRGCYVTRIWTNKKGLVYQNRGLELDLEGKEKLLQLKCQGYEIQNETN